MEIYLCHMIVYRVLEKMKLTHLFTSEMLSYIVVAVGTVIGAIIFAKVTQWLLAQGQKMIKKKVVSKMA